ncbi:proteasome assembly chaperone family protein [Halogranum rubrum]|uniref:Proteasome assembly chaperone family protein n=1 Tax=Halogranum salarium B-1 TaxID=1210908 RepID=J2ZDT3_9EURY|nr:PAC2 family protein [Halogranum salarium]EJN58835.1 hypothetical protein HSB1_22560 [Halogranum salarium B-1]
MVSDAPEAAFQIRHNTEPGTSLIAGFASFGLAGVVAADFLVDQLALTEMGHVVASNLPAFTPFENGTPRHHSRLFSRDDLDITVLVNELFIPDWAGNSFAQSILQWGDDHAIEEITVLSGVPLSHVRHDVFSIATTDYQSTRLTGSGVEPMASGSLTGVNAGLMARGIDSPLRTGLLVTPVHSQVPDVAAAIRLVETVEQLYGLDIDSTPLEAFAADVDQYYRDLAARIDAAEEEQVDDRMYL